MKCETVKDQLVLLAYGELSPEEQAELELHLHACPACEEEQELLVEFGSAMQAESLPEISPNFLTASRMRLDEALDEAGQGTLLMRARAALAGTWHHLSSAPALATLLVGIGFLGGNALTKYQVALEKAHKPSVINFSNEAAASISAISGISSTPDPRIVQVEYTRLVPNTFQGNLDEPETRQLLMIAAQRSADNAVRQHSVALLGGECQQGHLCEHAESDLSQGAGVRDALLVSLRYDRSPSVRLKALEGLQGFVAEDAKVRDAVLESLMHDASADVRTHAISTLVPVEGDSSVRQVLHTVSTQDDNPYIRNASIQVLGNVNGIQ